MTQYPAFTFYVGATPPPGAALPCFVLSPDEWDDYSYRTQFHLYAYRGDSQAVSLGKLKILPRGLTKGDDELRRTLPALPPVFSSLPVEQYCSLGQSSQYYSELARLAEYLRQPVQPEWVVAALADLCFTTTSDRWWESEGGFETSLLRFPASNIARRGATSLLRGETPKEHNQNALLVSDVAHGSVEPRGYELRFDGTLPVPGRLNVIVGRNGSGKTTLLGNMAFRLSADVSFTSRERKPPKFSRIAYVSNNVFDEGVAPGRNTDICVIGWRPGNRRQLQEVVAKIRATSDDNWEAFVPQLFPKREGVLAMLPEAEDHLREDLVQLTTVPDWRAFAAQVVDDQGLCESLVQRPRDAVDEMSAGQKALVGVLAGLFRNLDEQGLVLLDEPENYLHPSLVARFIRHLNVLLSERRAFAVVATHSPIVVQETPSQFVTIIEREGSTLRLSRPDFETFGESVENIDEYLFETDFASSHWKKVLSDFAERGWTDEQIRATLQSPKLPLLAQAYLERARLRHGRR